ncbi:hypothetical protein E2C01_088506 [Portunus trituberculatus]|uniref:Uncharacterized protein n=1 Tax=Portunus trituberculatus TaxID=210409 RepID=A0A5B7J9F7_PORTR|nr:hypothetical protein [Portunus trituberculatus]
MSRPSTTPSLSQPLVTTMSPHPFLLSPHCPCSSSPRSLLLLMHSLPAALRSVPPPAVRPQINGLRNGSLSVL